VDVYLSSYRNEAEGCNIFKLVLPDFRVAQVRLDPVDRALVFGNFPGDEESKTPLADQLLRLQTLVFRMEQQEYERRRKRDSTPP
jgi:hypothetical protein